MKVARASLVVLLAALFAATAFSYASSTGQRGVGSGPIEVGVLVSSPTVFPGGFGSADVVIQNDHPFITANVEFNVAIIFSDGMVQPLTGLGSPITLAPGGGLFLGIAFIVPPNAAPGPATFACRARANIAGVPGPPFLFAGDNDTFTVM